MNFFIDIFIDIVKAAKIDFLSLQQALKNNINIKYKTF